MTLQLNSRFTRYLTERPKVILLMMILFGLLYYAVILYPSYANGYPSGYDTYIHAGTAYLIAKGGLVASPASPIYPPLFPLLVAWLYEVTGVYPLYLIYPIGIVSQLLSTLPMYYITKRISGNNEAMALLAVFFTILNPITTLLLLLGTVPNLLGILGLILILAILVSGHGSRPIGVLSMALLGTFIFYMNILVSAFYIFLVGLIFIHEIILRRENRYFKPLFFSLLIAVPLAAAYYLPRLSYFYVGTIGGTEYLIWSSNNLILLPILSLPGLFIFVKTLKERYIPSKHQHLNLLRLWYLSPPVIAIIFVWQAAIASRMWHFISYPAIVVLAIIVTMKFMRMKKFHKRNTVIILTAILLGTTFTSTFITGTYCMAAFHDATPERLQVIDWIRTSTPANARFCTEEEYFSTHLGWYIIGLTGKMAYESLLSFAEPFEVGVDIARNINLANNITTLQAGSAYWIQAVKALNVTYVILLESEAHPNYTVISNDTVFSNAMYVVYNVTEYTSMP